MIASRRRSVLTPGAVALVCLAAVLALAATASAKTVELHVLSTSFEGADSVGAPQFPDGTLEKIDVDKTTGTVYVASSAGRVYKFDANGVSQVFSSLEPNTVLPTSINGLGDLEVDNSGTASQGRFYTFPEFGPVKAWDPSGAATTGTSFPLIGGGDVCGGAVSADGHFWRHTWQERIVEFDSTGTSTGTIGGPSGGYCDFDMDALGNFYAPSSYDRRPDLEIRLERRLPVHGR